VSSIDPNGRVDLPDGRWLVMRPMSGNDLIALYKADISFEVSLQRLASAVIEKSWDGDVLDLPWSTLRKLLREWRQVSEEVALPPVGGES